MEKLTSILLVEDDEATKFAHTRLLRQLEVSQTVVTAADGREALSLLTSQPPFQPALLLLDVNMPELDGIEFLEAFLHLPAAQREATRIVMLTTFMAARDLARLNELPIAGLVSKPLTRDKINTLLQLHFHRQLPDA